MNYQFGLPSVEEAGENNERPVSRSTEKDELQANSLSEANSSESVDGMHPYRAIHRCMKSIRRLWEASGSRFSWRKRPSRKTVSPVSVSAFIKTSS
jgi:hypothetical protein